MRTRRITAVLTSGLVVVSAAVSVALATRSHSRPPLVLVSGGKVVSDAALAPIAGPVPFHYRLSTPAPDLGSDAPVARLEVPTVDAERIVAMAHAFGLDGPAVDTHPGWQVSDGAARLTVTPATGGWDVAYALDAGNGAPGTVPGSAGSGGAPGSSGSGSSGGSGGSSGSGGSTGSGNAVSVPPSPPKVVLPPLPPSLPTETTPQIPARNLPSTARAEQIARSLLTKLGVADDSWSVTAFDSSGDTVTCSAPPCAEPDVLLASRTGVLSPTFQSVAVDGIFWNIEIGDNGAIDSASGLWTRVHTIDRYPLRSVAAVFADLATGVGDSTSPGPVGARGDPGASPDHVIEPVTVSIDRVTLGYAAVPAAADRGEVLDIVPKYVFSGRTSAGDPITQTMVAVVAAATPPPTTSDVIPMTAEVPPVT